MARAEQETVILFNEEEKTASVYTCNGRLKNKLAALCVSRPEEVKQAADDKRGGITFIVPKKWIRIKPPRNTSPLTAEQKQKRIALLNEARKARFEAKI